MRCKIQEVCHVVNTLKTTLQFFCHAINELPQGAMMHKKKKRTSKIHAAFFYNFLRNLISNFFLLSTFLINVSIIPSKLQKTEEKIWRPRMLVYFRLTLSHWVIRPRFVNCNKTIQIQSNILQNGWKCLFFSKRFLIQKSWWLVKKETRVHKKAFSN